jgi:hypothetical protein
MFNGAVDPMVRSKRIVPWSSGVGALLNGSVDVVVGRGSDIIGVSSSGLL